jgi:phage portal protein BeeE
MSADGLAGLSPVTQCRLALSLSANLQEHAKQYFEESSRPSGILTMPPGASDTAMDRLREDWRNQQGGVQRITGLR